MHLLEPVGHELERFAQPLFERGVQLFVDGAAHFFELGRVVRLDILQPLLRCVARTSAKRRSFASVSCPSCSAQRVAERLSVLPCSSRACWACSACSTVTHCVELLRETVDLAALHRRHAAELRGERLLKLREAAALLGARHARSSR